MSSSSRIRLSSIFAARHTATPPSMAAERTRSGTLGPEDAHHLLDKLLEQATPVPERAMNYLLAALARTLPSALRRRLHACRRALQPHVQRLRPAGGAAHDLHLRYPHRLVWPGAPSGPGARLLRPPPQDGPGCGFGYLWQSPQVPLRDYDARRTDEAADVLLRRMPEFACVPNAVMYSILLKCFCDDRRSRQALKCFCDDRRSRQALELLRLMAQGRTGCSPDVVAYSTVIDGLFKEGKVTKACDLFYEMIQQGISPNVVTYNSIIDALCKTGAMDKAEVLLRQMVDKGVMPGNKTYNSLIHGYSTRGQWKGAVRIFKQMTKGDIQPNVVTWNSLLSSLCKHGRIKEVREVFDSMSTKGQKPDAISYSILLHAYANEGMMDDAMHIFKEMRHKEVKPNVVTYSTVIAAFCRMGQLDCAMDVFSQTINHGIPPNEAVYHCLIQAFCCHGDLVKGKKFISEMIDKVCVLTMCSSVH